MKRNIDKKRIREIIEINPDSRQYFFAKADHRWLEWLWDNGFLNELKKPADDIHQYSFSTPEISYLSKVADTVPKKVVEIILDPQIATSQDNFRPELIDQCLRILSSFNAAQVAQVIPKLHSQNWVRIMGNFNHFGFDYKKIFETLFGANDFSNLLLLSETVLTIRTKEEITSGDQSYGASNPFYFKDLDQTEVFEFLLKVPDGLLEKTLEILIRSLIDILHLFEKRNEDSQDFHLKDTFHLFDVDFFNHSIGQKERYSFRDDVRELMGLITELITRLIRRNCENEIEAQRIFDKFCEVLPVTRMIWRFRLYVLSICPVPFKDKLQLAFNRVFDVENYFEVAGGAEYEKALRKVFEIFSEKEQRDYVINVLLYFTKEDDNKQLFLNKGSKILSVINNYLNEEERLKAQSLGFTIIPDYEPMPDVGKSMSGIVQPQGPINKSEFGSLPVDTIITNLKGEWSPKRLYDKYNQSDNFLFPHNADGVARLLEEDIAERLQDYVNNANGFIDRSEIDIHYTYHYILGIEKAIKIDNVIAAKINWDALIQMFLSIKLAGGSGYLERGDEERAYDTWFVGWNSIYSAMISVIQQLLVEFNGSTLIDFKKHRENIFDIISYLLKYPEPTPQKESHEDAMMSTTRNGHHLVSDPFSIAINSVRGRAFRTFVSFTYPDGKELDEGLKIKPDVKSLYEQTLAKENTRAITFMYGHYLPQFYFRDRTWIKSLMQRIFTENPEKSHLFLAALEGYLTNNLYKELFDDPHVLKLYFRGLDIEEIKESNREYFKDVDEGIASHIALAIVHYRKDFNFDHPLFQAFWKKDNLKQHTEFVKFIGHSVLSKEGIANILTKQPEAVERLVSLWEWIINNCQEKDVFKEFGFWIKPEVFDLNWLAQKTLTSLEKTSGIIEWEYDLVKSAIKLAERAPKEMLKITELVLLEGVIKSNSKLYHLDQEWEEVLQILYQNPSTKKNAEALISVLIRDGGRAFWNLRNITSQ